MRRSAQSGLGRSLVVASTLSLGGFGHANADPVVVSIAVSNDTVFTDGIDKANVWLAVGDVTNDGRFDLVVTKGLDPMRAGGAQAAVFEGAPGAWDGGTRLAGLEQSTAYHPVIGRAHNDAREWLVVGEHRWGNTGGLVRSLAFSGAKLVAKADVTDQIAWPFKSAPALADLEGDGVLDVWVNYEYGVVPDPYFHLQRYTWDAASGTYTGGDVVQGGIGDEPRPSLAGDFAADGSTTLIWQSAHQELSLARHVAGAAYSSTPIFTGELNDFAAGELDGLAGDDVAVMTTLTGHERRLFAISGGTLAVRALGAVLVADHPRALAVADLDGDGLGEIYVCGLHGGIYRFDAAGIWTQIHADPAVSWSDAVTVRWPGAAAPSVLFAGTTTGTGFQILSLDAAPDATATAAAGSSAGGGGGTGCQAAGREAGAGARVEVFAPALLLGLLGLARRAGRARAGRVTA